MRLTRLFFGLSLSCILLCGCSQSQTQQTTTIEEATTVDANLEEGGTVREYATVEEITEDHIAVKTTKDELYWIDAAYDDGFEVGGLVLVIYETDGKAAEGDHFNVTPTSVTRSSTEIIPSE